MFPGFVGETNSITEGAVLKHYKGWFGLSSVLIKKKKS